MNRADVDMAIKRSVHIEIVIGALSGPGKVMPEAVIERAAANQAQEEPGAPTSCK